MLRAGLHKMLLLLFPGMLGTQGHALIQSTAPLKLLFSHENLWLWMEPKRVPRAKRHDHSPMQCLSKGPFQSPAGASSTGLYLALIFPSETSPVLSGAKCLVFLLPLFCRIFLVRGSVFLPLVAVPSSYASRLGGNETAQLLSQHLYEGHALQ